MALYTYEALTEAGRLMRGTLEAGSRREAVDLLAALPLQVQQLEPAPSPPSPAALSREDFLLFNEQLATLAEAGIPLERGLREVSRDIAAPRTRSLIADIATDLEAGTPLDEAFERRGQHLPPLYGFLIRAGIRTGRLGPLLRSLGRQMAQARRTRQILIETFTYPALVLGLLALVTGGLYTWVVPQFARVAWEINGARLPAFSAFVFAAAPWIWVLWLAVLGGLGAVALGWYYLGATPRGRRLREGLVLRLPALGFVYHHSVLARLAESLAVSVDAGQPLPEGLRLAACAAGSESLHLECSALADHLDAGSSVLEGGVFCVQIPRLFLYALQLGIQRNDLAGSLRGLAELHDDHARTAQDRLHGTLLPVAIVALGLLLAGMILGLFLPFIQLFQAFM